MELTEPLRAGIYLRISEDRRDGAGVERQEKECRERAERLGWQVVKVFEDNDISASSFSRKVRSDYQRMVEAINAGQINAVIAWDSDRMFRQPSEHEPYMKLCQQYGVQNAAVRVGDIDYDTPIGRFNARMHINMAAYESEHKADRIRSAHRQIAENGGWKGGIRCFGYEKDGVTVRESEAAEVRRIADAVIRGQSLRSLALEFNERGVPTVKGKRWSSAHLRSMLVRSRLAGLREHRGKIIGQAAWPAILDRTTWEACKAVLEDPARCTGGGGRRGRVPTSLGTAIYICGVCHEPRLRLGRSNGRSPVYRCGNMDMSNDLGHVSRVADKLDAYVEGALLEIISRPGVVEAMCNVVDTDDHDITALQQEQAEIRKELKKLAASCDAGDIDAEQLAIASRRKRQRDKEITATLTAAQQRSPVSVLLGADNIEAMWDNILTMGQKRAILAETLVVTVLPTNSGGRVPGGGYFNRAAIDIQLTDRARGVGQLQQVTG
ncbi:recombinase family protein [Mycobacterium sp.]|uniref:recombinase family protein n=1 Tax=Mycobacterium sp. TaxID=1785 RepID=UPI003F9CA3A3